MWTARSSLAVLAIGFSALTPAAHAAGNPNQGVHVDPGSPAGKQYAIPIASARGETSGGKGSGSGSSAPPLFGVGVTASTTTSATTTKTPAVRHSSRAHKRRAGRRTRPHRHSAKPSATTVAAVSAASSRGTGWLPLLTGGVLVLVFAGGGGLLLRRRL